MNELPHLLKRCLPKLATACLLTPLLLLTSCSSTKNQNTGAANGEYNYPNDGSYHPYNQSAGGSGSSSHYKEYSPSGNSNAPGYQPQGADGNTYADNGSGNPPPKKKKKKTTHTDSDDVASSSSGSHTKSSSTTHKSSSSSGNYRSYVIKHGDTYYSLAKKYHTSVATLKRINGRSSDTLRDGEKIKIPPRKSDA